MTPRVRRAHCGHLVPVDMEPNAIFVDGMGEHAGWVCQACEQATRARPPQVETKEVKAPRARRQASP